MTCFVVLNLSCNTRNRLLMMFRLAEKILLFNVKLQQWHFYIKTLSKFSNNSLKNSIFLLICLKLLHTSFSFLLLNWKEQQALKERILSHPGLTNSNKWLRLMLTFATKRFTNIISSWEIVHLIVKYFCISFRNFMKNKLLLKALIWIGSSLSWCWRSVKIQN
jgi:hypothetical protein